MRWLKRIAFALPVVLVALATGAWLLWNLKGREFLYGTVLPDARPLLENQQILELTAEVFRDDLAYLESELPRLHIEYARAFDREDVARRTDELTRAADSLTPEQRALELFGLLALGGTGTGHTMVFPLQLPLDWRIYPLTAFHFDDGLFVTHAGAKHQDAVGQRIVSIGGVPAPEALERLAPYVASDNPSSLASNLTLMLGLAEPMIAAGLAADDGVLELELETAGTRRLQPLSMTSFAAVRWSRTMFAPADDAWSPADTRRRARAFSLDYRADSRLLVLTLNELRNEADESIPRLAERLAATAHEVDFDRFVIDLQSNSGGNNTLAEPLVSTISGHPRLDRPGRIFVLVGRRTFSAAANLALALERRTRATFVGETSGFAPNHYGDAITAALPGSKILVRIASRYWGEDLPGLDRVALEPDIPVELTSAHHFNARNPALDAIRDYDPPLRVTGELPEASLGTYLLTPVFGAQLSNENGRGRLTIHGAGPYAVTDLYPAADGVFESDVRGMRLAVQGGNPTLHWHEASWPLERVDESFRLPFQLLEEGRIEAGAEAFRAATGIQPLSSSFEMAINEMAYRALRDERLEDALLLFTLNTELFPVSANTWDGLGDAYRTAGRLDEARAAYRAALERYSVFPPSLRSLAELEGG